ncbi:TDG/mug DNA glycosylase family protein [Nocardioides zeae]|uniref:TDG/mug DNA glycosylase family protein n=1 Tax=Nocardioides zeae TaxID=1457234 RepID=A0ACC6IFQ8_9ACTN|nr:uracil-DNA glycosylase family protein [Nocardioides zeae]MDR6176564.1 TDG/mug DNA glycosylase family protein [Nocardioides zeae]MDR6209576.1 TDG/mug DNA glycosylase family protein [Nocardioides zeae]
MTADDLRTTVDWRGTSVLTLADLWPERPRAMVVGLHPVPCSVEAGHYFQGQVGQRQLRRLASTGLLPAPDDGTFFEPGALAAGVGFANVVRRPASGAAVSPDEVAHGREVLLEQLAERAVPLVVCLTRLPVKALLGREGRPGYQAEELPGGTRVFRMPGPFAPQDEVADVLAGLEVPD